MRRLDSITQIERFIVDSLLSSPLVPLGVNVVRLAADYDAEGIAAMAYSTTVRYVGSSISETNSVPLQTERTMNFELTHAAQSYLSQSGHDYALQLCAAAELTLTNSVPRNTGMQVQTPFWLASESFQGLTDSSHYVYVQNFSLVVDEIHEVPTVDPCVWAGNCSYLFPSYMVNELQPGDVLNKNDIYRPVAPPSLGSTYDPAQCGVVVKGPDLYYKYAQGTLFVANWEQHKFVNTGLFDVTGQFLKVNVYDADNSLVLSYFASNCEGLKVLSLGTDLWMSRLGRAGNPTESNGPDPLPPIMMYKNGFGYAKYTRVNVYVNPSDPQADIAQIRYGVVYKTLSGVTKTFTVDGEETEFYLIGGTPIGKAYVRTDQFILLEWDPTVGCDDGDLIDEGTEEGEGPLPPC